MTRYRVSLGPRSGQGRYRLQVEVELSDDLAGEYSQGLEARVVIQQIASKAATDELGAEGASLRVWAVQVLEPDGVWREAHWAVEANGTVLSWPR